MKKFNDSFLARWIVGEASAEEVNAFKSHADYKKYEKIRQASDALSFTEFDGDKALEQLKASLKKEKSKKHFTEDL